MVSEAAFIKNTGLLFLHSLPLPNLFGYFHLHTLMPVFKKRLFPITLGRK